mmetsp:Transcript_28200/g.51885  ORF Transcript_28200/g.51885 Transcript_28200/m.51885 type:complete len:100 (-) Transcript_28200:1947-2246(-)
MPHLTMATKAKPAHQFLTCWMLPKVAGRGAFVAARELGSAWSVALRQGCAAYHWRLDALCPTSAGESIAQDDAARLALAQVAEVLADVLSTGQHLATDQ